MTPKPFQEHYQNLVFVQRHKCFGTYFLWWGNARSEHNMASHTIKFRFPLNFQWTWSIEFFEMVNGGFKADLPSKINDPRMNQFFKMHLHIWIANCDLNIALDEKEAIRYLVKYASKAESIPRT